MDRTGGGRNPQPRCRQGRDAPGGQTAIPGGRGQEAWQPRSTLKSHQYRRRLNMNKLLLGALATIGLGAATAGIVVVAGVVEVGADIPHSPLTYQALAF